MAGLIALSALANQAAIAHVGPAVRENNHYIHINPLGDQIRIAYTVFFGELPGHDLRAEQDRNRDGDIDDTESRQFGERIAAAVRSALHIEVDGEPAKLVWDQVHVVLGTHETNAGSFSVELSAWLCLITPRERSHHSFSLSDRYRIGRSGESELFVEHGPGLELTRSGFDGGMVEERQAMREFRWKAAPGASDGIYRLEFEVDPRTAMFADNARCPSEIPGRWGHGGALIAALALLVTCGVVVHRCQGRRK
jgi:hypothetical protein